MKVLIFKVNHLGDNVVFLPVVQGLRAALPAAGIVVVTSPAEAPLYRGVLGATDLFAPAGREAFNAGWRQRPWAVPGWMARLWRVHADATLVSYDQGNFAHLLARGFGGEVRVGASLPYIRVRNSLTQVVPAPDPWNAVDWNWAMGRALLAALAPGAAWPATPPVPDLSHLAGTAQPGNRVIIHAGTKMAMRQWPLSRFAELADRFSQHYDVTWIDRPETRGVALPKRVRVARPNSLEDLVTLLAGAKLYFGNNSGPMHVANVLGCPGVIVSGPSAYGWDPYWHRARWRVLRHPNLACLPCERATIVVERCANLAAPLACLDYWSVDAVEAAGRELLARAG